MTDAGVVIRTRVAEIRETGRNTQGVRVIRLADEERVVDVEPIARDEEEEAEEKKRKHPTKERAARRPRTTVICDFM
jgi:DNA gyrase subunit A